MTRDARIGIITCDDLGRYFLSSDNPLFTHDDRVAVDMLRERGHRVEPILWGTPMSDLKAQEFDLLIMRSPWDYMYSDDHRQRFVNWCRELASSGLKVANPTELMLWNLDKNYLGDLQKKGVPVVPTTFLRDGEEIKLIDWVAEHGPTVIKPTISAGAIDTHCVHTRAEAAAFEQGGNEDYPKSFAQLRTPGREFMLQPFLREILSEGEFSLVFFGDKFSHAVRKRPQPGNWLVQDELGGSVASERPSDKIIQMAEQAIHALPVEDPAKDLLYARVDVIPTRNRGPLIGEVELIEPELFFLDRYVDGNRPNEEVARRFCNLLEQSWL